MQTCVNLSDDGYKIIEAVVDTGSHLYFRLSNPKVKNIDVHAPQGEGDKWFIRVEFSNNDIVDYFNIVDIVWEKTE